MSFFTSHASAREGGLTDLISKQLRYGYFMRNTSHSHPGGTRYPSGLYNKDMDIGFARHVQSIFGKNVSFSIYIPNDNTYIPYTPNSEIDDFIDALPSIELNQIEVKP